MLQENERNRKLEVIIRQMEIDDVNLAAGIDPIILGPGRLEAAHTPEESATFQQIVQASEIYLHFALSL